MRRGSILVRVAGLGAVIAMLAATMEPAPPSRPDFSARYHVMPGYYAEGAPEGAEATRVGWQPGQVTPTPCPWWEYTADPWQPVPWCMSPVIDATHTAGVADGSIYGLNYHWDGESKTPTVTSYGTVPPHAAATWTALTLEEDGPAEAALPGDERP